MMTDDGEFVIIEFNNSPFMELICADEQAVNPQILIETYNMIGIPINLDQRSNIEDWDN